MRHIKVLVVDSQSLFRRGVAQALSSQESIEIVGEASDGLQAIERARELHPDVVLMELVMPRCGGIAAAQALHSDPDLSGRANILILTVSDNEADFVAAIDAGAKGYILKDVDGKELIRAVHHTARGGLIVSPSMAAKMLTRFRSGRPLRHSPDVSGSPKRANLPFTT